MSSVNIYILGAGGMAREVFQIYHDLKKSKLVKGFIVNIDKYIKNKIYSLPVENKKILLKKSLLIGAMGHPKRKIWINTLMKEQYKFDTLIHPAAVIGKNVKIGVGSIVCAGTFLTCDINIGNHTIINIGTSIHHDCNIGSFVTVGPGSNITGKVSIGDETFIGAGVTIIPEVKIGKSVYIGAGSTVVSNIPDNYLAYGVPAKPIKKISNNDLDNLV